MFHYFLASSTKSFLLVSQCSIDSLLERTIKHMLFLQGITKHADKLTKCANMKVVAYLHGLET